MLPYIKVFWVNFKGLIFTFKISKTFLSFAFDYFLKEGKSEMRYSYSFFTDTLYFFLAGLGIIAKGLLREEAALKGKNKVRERENKILCQERQI